MKEAGTAFPTGPLRYKLTNDFLFKAFFQRSRKALEGFLCALLNLQPEQIKSAEILNPIELGKQAEDKDVILDVKVLLNNDQVINIEMQVQDCGNWEERSLVYLCRAFDQLNVGEDYSKLMKTVHIGILDFTPEGFPECLYGEYCFYDRKHRHIYSDKMAIRVLQLNQLGNPYDERKMPELYRWAQLLKATTWEEVKMLAEKSEAIKEGMATLRMLEADEKIRMQCEAREKYRRDIVSATQKGYKEGKAESILELLEEAGEVPETLREKIMAEKDKETLNKWLKMAAKANGIEEFARTAFVRQGRHIFK